MFTTFTGTSRRPRNVNLSGQKSNPFAGTSWNPPSSSGTAKSVADAQADRRQRQQERERLKAAQQIQRTWRGHKEREEVRRSRRRAFDTLYEQVAPYDYERRLLQALPLLLGIFSTREPADLQRLVAFTEDLWENDYAVIVAGKFTEVRLKRLARIFIAALNKDEAPAARVAYLTSLVRLVETCPGAVSDDLERYFTLVARLCAGEVVSGTEPTLRKAVVALLATEVHSMKGTFTDTAYLAFVMSFLALPDLTLVEQNAGKIASSINSERLSTTILNVFASGAIASLSTDRRLWLLAHFIALQRAQPSASRNSVYAKALYTQLSSLAGNIKRRPGVQAEKVKFKDTEMGEPGLPGYISGQLASLVQRGEISELLEKFTFNYAGASLQAAEDASILAGYILTLIRCFPSKGDDIRMRLYLASISDGSQKIPSVRFFWNAVTKTQVFSRIVSHEGATLNFLLQRTYFQPSSVAEDSVWDREWRTVLLFLELYVFVLRLTDDEDFFSAFTGAHVVSKPQSRLGSCSLPLADVRRLSLFLRNLGFTLHYNSADLLRVRGPSENSVASLDDIVSVPTAAGTSRRRTRRKEAPKFSVISGIDFDAFRNIVTTAVNMLYERDSRRPFLPDGHWLMTSRFDMEGFLSAVVLEEQRQHELMENESDGDDGDGRPGKEEEEEEQDDDDDGDVNMVGGFGGGGNTVFTSAAGQRLSRYALIEQNQARLRKQQRDQTLASIGPKLEVLRSMPFVIPFETRVQIFRQFVFLDKQRRRGGSIDADQWRASVLSQNGGLMDPAAPGRVIIGRHHAKIRRENVFDDAREQFYELGDGLKEPIQITFVDQFDTPEAGIDGGGVTKEFLTSVTMEAFTGERHNLFVANRSNALYPNPSAFDSLHESLRRMGLDPKSEEWAEQVQRLSHSYEFLGRIVGKCMYEGILIDVVFAGFFLLKWASSATESGYRASVNDLREMDEELYQGLLRLKNLEGDVSALELDFTISDQVSLPGDRQTLTVTRSLMPNGRDVAVTNENRPLYISYVARHRLVVQPHLQTRAFLRGLGSIIDPGWLCMFNQKELQTLVGGDSSEIDVEDLRGNTVYSGVYAVGDDGREHPTVELFWEAMRQFADSERRDVLKYVTSTPRAPLLGFSQLQPKFSIRDGGGDVERLPSASTCVNLLKLPRYVTLEQLRSKLKYAISSNAGFDLS